MTKQVKDLQMKESITICGISWSKFAEDGEGNAYMLADEKICDMAFGKTNDWRKSPIREKLNNKLQQEIVAELGINSLVAIQTDLFSLDGQRNYGKCEDMVSLLTFDLVRNNQENIKPLKDAFWICTPDSTTSGHGQDFAIYVFYKSYVDRYWCGKFRAVRPFIILNSLCILRNCKG